LQDDIMEAFENKAREDLLGLNVLLAIIIILAIMTFAGLIIIVRMRRKAKLLEEASEQSTETAPEIDEDKPQEIDLKFLQEQKQDEIKKQLDKFAAEQPEAVAQLLRNWLTEE